MADPGITLNIYNKPPQLNEDEENNDNNDNNNNNINQTATDINQTTNLPTKSVVENGRIDATSAPRANYNINIADNTRNNNIAQPPPIPVNYQRNIQPIPMQQYPQQMIRPMVVTPVATPMVQPYNVQYPQYAQPVIIQQPNVNNQPRTVVIRKEKRESSSSSDCCAGFLGGCGACLAACCLLSLCAGGGRGYRRGRW